MNYFTRINKSISILASVTFLLLAVTGTSLRAQNPVNLLSSIKMVNQDRFDVTLPNNPDLLMVLIVGVEFDVRTDDPFVTATYGGRTMIKVGSVRNSYLFGSLGNSELAAFYLDEDELNQAMGNEIAIDVQSGARENMVATLMIFENVSAASPVPDVQIGSVIGGTSVEISNPLSPDVNNYVLTAGLAYDGGGARFSTPNTYTRIERHKDNNLSMEVAGRMITNPGASEQPEFTVQNWRTRGLSTLALNIQFSDVILPVEMLGFEATTFRGGTILEWVTAKEESSDYFTVERSRDGEDWDALTTVDAAGYSEEPVLYEAIDRKPRSGVNHYRIRTTDLDGSSSLTQVRSVFFEGVSGQHIDFEYLPTTASVRIHSEDDLSSYQMSMIDFQGRTVAMPVSQSADEVIFNVAGLPSGNYIVVGRSPRDIYKVKFQVH